MTSFDNAFVPLATELLDEFGKDMQLIRKTNSIASPLTGGTIDQADDSQSIKGMPPFPFDKKWLPDSVIEDGDLVTVIAAENLTFTPQTTHTISFDGVRYRIPSVQPLYSGELVAAYILQLRG